MREGEARCCQFVRTEEGEYAIWSRRTGLSRGLVNTPLGRVVIQAVGDRIVFLPRCTMLTQIFSDEA